MSQLKTLIVYPRRGLFQVTTCNDCKFSFKCDQCDANLVTYRNGNYLSLLCHHCQTWYGYPSECARCHSKNIGSFAGGIEKLEEEFKNEGVQIYRVDTSTQTKLKKEFQNIDAKTVYLTTRLFDPSIPYEKFERVLIVRAEALLASADYLVSEDTRKSLLELILAINGASLEFDVDDANRELFVELQALTKENVAQWYTDFLNNEAKHREKFKFPSFYNLVLFTTQEKSKEKSNEKIQSLYIQLRQYSQQLHQLDIQYPYTAKMLKRKGMYAHHCLLKFPKNYAQFAELSKMTHDLRALYSVQVRLNPRHIF
jgi:primosomal protein N' (replication factor Y) (superfamily II helicase)